MTLLVKSLGLAVAQLSDAAVLRVLAKSIVLTLAAFVALGYGFAKLLPLLLDGYLDLAAESYVVIGALLALAAGWFLFRMVALAVLQLFADEVVLAVEQRHYPAAAYRAKTLSFREDAANSLRSVGRTIAVNLIAIPVALLLIPTAIGPAIAFFGANAVLLGRELTEMTWLRHRPDPEAFSPVRPLERLLLGMAIAALLLVPFANLLAPVIGAAAGTHLVQQAIVRRRA